MTKAAKIYFWLRGCIFNIWMCASALVLGFLFCPLLLAPESWLIGPIRLWCSGNLFALRLFCGIRVEIKGREHIGKGPCLIAAKHQGMLDTLVPFLYAPNPSIVMKKELAFIPIFGWYAKKAGMMIIDRKAGRKALKSLIELAQRRFLQNRQIVIYPEGTRTLPGSSPRYKSGIAALYSSLNAPCILVATNSGRFWPAKGLMRYPGKVIFEILQPIPAGLTRDAFMEELERRLETASKALL